MLVEDSSMFCGLAQITRKRKMAGVMDIDPPYGVTTPPPEPEPSPEGAKLPWWADVIDCNELADVVRSQCDEKVLLIDCRSFIEFNQSNIVNSINVCCNKIVKRRLKQDKLKVQDFLSKTCQIEVDSTYTIVIYDNSTTDASVLPEDDIVAILGTKCSNAFDQVRVLYGGFLEFEANHPSLLETKTKTPHQQATASLSQPAMSVTNIGPTKILPFLFLGSMKDALNSELAKANGITYVLNVSMTCPKPGHIQDGHFLRIPVNDNYSEKLLPYFHEAFQFIDKVRESGGCVLVHCLAGVSRSPTLAIAYIMRTYHMVSEEAYRYVKEKRITISPNFNFLGQLLEYEQQMNKEDESNFSGSKRRCIEDLRAELSAPSSPVATPRLPKSYSIDASATRFTKAQSPTTALSKLRFDHCLTASVAQATSKSPTTAFAKLKFGTIREGNTTAPITDKLNTEPEFMQCFASDTIHQNTSAGNSPSTAKPRGLILNCNNSNNRMNSRSPSPNSPKPSRPMSLSLSRVDEILVTKPVNQDICVLEDKQTMSKTTSQVNQQTVSIPEATPPSEIQPMNSGAVVLREKTSHKNKIRPKSVALAENSPKEPVPAPYTPTNDYMSSPLTVPSNLNNIIRQSQDAQKSRSLEDMMSSDKACRSCCREQCICGNILSNMTSVAQSTGSISSTGSHNSLHGSLEIIKVL